MEYRLRLSEQKVMVWVNLRVCYGAFKVLHPEEEEEEEEEEHAESSLYEKKKHFPFSNKSCIIYL